MNDLKNDYNYVKLLEKVDLVNSGKISYYITPFINLEYQYSLEKRLKKDNINYRYYNNGERKCVIFGSFNESVFNKTNPIIILEIHCGEEIKHNDIMGSILNIGITREMVGNIYAKDGLYLVEIHNSKLDFIKENFTYISHNKIKLEEFNGDFPLPETVIKNVIISSLRLDNVISSIFNLSREQAKKMIEYKDVYLNFCNDLRADQKVQFDSYVSAKGRGKAFIIGEVGKTRKENMVIEVKYF